MSVSARVLVRSERAPSTIFLGLDVRKESVTSTVLPIDATAPTHVDRLAHDRQTLRRSLERRGPAATALRMAARLARADSVLAADDRIVFGESLALPEYNRSRRDEKVFHRLSAARPPQLAVVAVAREQVGFLWAVMRDAPEPLGYLPPAEYEAQHCAARSDSAALALK